MSPLRVITQTNSGKASALNTGLRHATGELVLCVDSDSKLSPDSLKWGVEHFSDPRVVAVAGHVEVANTQHMLTRFQQLEYIISQNFVRKGLSWLGIVTVIPGPVGLFKKQALLDLGGYSEDKNLFAEDADLTVRLLAKGWRIVSEDRMVASTEAPEEIYPLLRQRYRWKRGIYQTLHSNFKDLILSKGTRQPYLAGLLVLDGFLMEIMSFAVTVFIMASFFRFTELKLLYSWFGLLFTLDVLVLIVALGKQWWKFIPLLFLQKLIYGYALQGWGVLSLLDEWRSSKMSWDKVERVGGAFIVMDINWTVLLVTVITLVVLLALIMTIVLYVRHWADRNAVDNNKLGEGKYFSRYVTEKEQAAHVKRQAKDQTKKNTSIQRHKKIITGAVGCRIYFGHSNKPLYEQR